MTKKTEKTIRSDSSYSFPGLPESSIPIDPAEFARVIASALKQDFGGTGSAVKVIAALTGAHERAVRNWFEGKNSPAGFHLVALMRCSDRVLEAILNFSGREQVARDLLIASLSRQILESLKRIENQLQDTN
jgi:hypothetical protein